MSEELLAAVDTLESIICERYNVRSLTGVGPFGEAIEQARLGNIGPIRDALRGREMYRWSESAAAALNAVREAAAPKEPVKPPRRTAQRPRPAPEPAAAEQEEAPSEPEPAPIEEPVTLTESGESPEEGAA